MDRETGVRFFGGLGLTCALLAAMHWFPWFHEIDRVTAYVLGTSAILVGQGVYLGFDDRWKEMCSFSLLGGLVVILAYRYDEHANERVNRLAGGGRGISQGR
jgi:hypothetical protein